MTKRELLEALETFNSPDDVEIEFCTEECAFKTIQLEYITSHEVILFTLGN